MTSIDGKPLGAKKMKVVPILATVIVIAVLSPTLSAQNIELSGGWAHLTGNNGVDGFDVGAAAMFTSRIGIALNYDDTWDTSTIGAFELSSLGLTTASSHLQNFLVGPRVFFAQKKIKKKYVLSPFGEAQFGGSHLNQKLQQQGTGLQQSASDSGFTWMLGGGADYVVAPHWALRGNLDFVRTHFVNSGQSHLRFVLGVAYTIRRR